MMILTTSALSCPIVKVVFLYHKEIPDFLTNKECDHIVNLAEDIGMAKSDLHFDPNSKKHKDMLRSMEG